MDPKAKVGIVVAGYAAALGAGGVAGHLYNVRMAAQPYDTSGGMYAAGEMMAELAAFLPVALVSTLLALWFLRDHRGVWNAVALASLAFALAGLAGVLMPRVWRGGPNTIATALLALLGLAQLLGVPIWIVAFVLFAFIAPAGLARRTMVAAVAVELANAACAAVHWLVPSPPF